jgi:predicted RNA-binding Zn-ribbon protein involved in translation (DUF1610 family)
MKLRPKLRAVCRTTAKEVTMHEEDESEDVMQQPWACVACSSRFRFGQIRFQGGALACPTCGNTELFRADGRTWETDVQEGGMGPLN